MVGIDIFMAVLSICGFAVTVFVVVQLWKAMRRMLREMEPLTPGRRRENWWVALGTIGGLLGGAAVIYGTYRWGESEWGSRVGAAMAIGAFVTVIICFFAAAAMLGVRDARGEREQRSGHL